MKLNVSVVKSFESVQARIQSVYHEIAGLAKSKPNDPINRFKLGFINALIEECVLVIGTEHKPFKEFSFFDIESPVTTSDVTFILSAHLASMETFRDKNIHFSQGRWRWAISDDGGPQTSPPTKLGK